MSRKLDIYSCSNNKMANTIKKLEKLVLAGLVCMNIVGCAGINNSTKYNGEVKSAKYNGEIKLPSTRAFSYNSPYVFTGYQNIKDCNLKFATQDNAVLAISTIALHKGKEIDNICKEIDTNNNFNITEKEYEAYLNKNGITDISRLNITFSNKESKEAFYQDNTKKAGKN